MLPFRHGDAVPPPPEGEALLKLFPILYRVDRLHGGYALHGEEGRDEGYAEGYEKEYSDLTYAEVKEGYEQPRVLAENAVYHHSDREGRYEREHVIDHRDDKGFREEDTEDVIRARADGAEDSYILLLVRDARRYEVCEHERREYGKAYTDVEEYLTEHVKHILDHIDLVGNVVREMVSHLAVGCLEAL